MDAVKCGNKYISKDALDDFLIDYRMPIPGEDTDPDVLKIFARGRYVPFASKSAQDLINKRTNGLPYLIEVDVNLTICYKFKLIQEFRAIVATYPDIPLQPVIETIEVQEEWGGRGVIDPHPARVLTEIMTVKKAVVSRNMTTQEIYRLYKIISEMTTSGEYGGVFPNFTVLLQPFPVIDNKFDNLFDGDINCVIKPLLDELVLSKKKAATLLKYAEDIKESGASYQDIQNISALVGCRISVYDILGHAWADFVPSLKRVHRKHFLMIAHNKHATNTINPFSIMLKKPDGTPKNNIFVDIIEIEKYPNVIQVAYKRDSKIITSIKTTTDVIKTKFDEYEQYPEAYTDGQVGKIKFLEQHPQYKYIVTPSYELLKSDQSGFYARTQQSSKANIKFDMNQAYRSFEYSGCFKGFPSALNQSYSFKYNTRVSDIPALHEMCGLLFVEFAAITPEQLIGCSPIYYNGSGYYPIEIVVSLFRVEGINPMVREVILSASSFNVDFSAYTKDQFRSFIGKTTSKISKNTVITYSKDEFAHLLYKLGKSVISYSIDILPMTITYETSIPVWSCFQIGSYVKAHQKLTLFRQINKLLSSSIVPVFVSVDGLEILKKDYKKALPLFDIGTKLGQWKIEDVNMNNFTQIKVVSHEIPYIHTERPVYEEGKSKSLPRLLHVSGPAGNGKTQTVLELSKTHGYSDIVYLCPENDLITTLKAKAKELGVEISVYTYHKYFGIGCPHNINVNHNTFVFEECSKLSPKDFLYIDAQLKEHCDPTTTFGGKQIILAGDFKQLQPVDILKQPMNEDGVLYETIEDMPIYKTFNIMELKHNYRQQSDLTFYNLCNEIRYKDKLSPTRKREIIDILNTRVHTQETIAALDLTGDDSIYIAGRNNTCDELNRSPQAQSCKKIINTVKHNTSHGIIHNGERGHIIGKERSVDNSIDIFTVEFNGVEHKYYGKYPSDAIKRAYALTVHRVQGRTCSDKVVLDPSTLFAKNHLYVAITRAIKFDSLYLSSALTLETFNRC